MTNVLVVADGHYYRDANGDVYVESVFNYDFYRRYLCAFDQVIAVGRMSAVEQVPVGKKRADGPGVTFVDLEPGRGLAAFLKTGLANRATLRSLLKNVDCAIVRVPGVVANQAVTLCEQAGLPFAVEVVVDPWEYFAKGVNGGLVAPFVRRAWTRSLKKACLCANGVSYVTERYLQERYPCLALEGKSGYFTNHYSSVELPDDSFGSPREYVSFESIKIAHVANSFSGNAKGHITLFRAVKQVLDEGYDVRLMCVGDGPSMPDFLNKVKELGIEQCVVFTGRLADGMEVRRTIRNSDLFVFPTKAEGLPRVLLEAMSEGMPCLSSPVCGIPEILPRECLFDSEDVNGFAGAIIKCFNNPRMLTEWSVNNLQIAKRYSSSVLGSRRAEFYNCLRNACETD